MAEWIRCPVCGNKTRLQIRENTELKNFPLYSSKQELVDRIYQYFDEVNETPVVYHWKYRMDEF